MSIQRKLLFGNMAAITDASTTDLDISFYSTQKTCFVSSYYKIFKVNYQPFGMNFKKVQLPFRLTSHCHVCSRIYWEGQNLPKPLRRKGRKRIKSKRFVNKGAAKISKDLNFENDNLKSLILHNWTRCKVTFAWICDDHPFLLINATLESPRENHTLIKFVTKYIGLIERSQRR